MGKFKDLVDSIEDEKLEIWLNSALTALIHCRVDHDYVIKPVEKPSWAGKTTETEIVIVDKVNTGRLMPGMQATRGIQAFLEAKHHLTIHAENAVPASLSHPLF